LTSVRVSDEFMRRAVSGGDWSLRAVTTGEVLETFSARRLLCACAEAVARCGDPGMLFADQIARWHTCPNTGPVTASNPCGEFLHVADSACNLATLNLLAFRRGCDFDIDEFIRAVELLVIAQDAIVDGSGYPSEAIERNAHRLGQIGIGYAILAALLLTRGIPYDSDQGRDWAAALTALLTAAGYRRSAELAGSLGPFAEFERNREPMLRVIERHIEALHQLGGEQPAEVKAEGLSITQSAERLGRSPATITAYFYDPTGEKARAVKTQGVHAAKQESAANVKFRSR
jgi:ribonucleoside-diphosphate reductase alpha chain